jgi:hypothetical protein
MRVIGRIETRATRLMDSPARARSRQRRVFAGVGRRVVAAPSPSASTALMPNHVPLLVRRSIAIVWPGSAPVTVTGSAIPAAR